MPIKFLNDVAVDTSVLYVDTTNDRVGIGTTSPDVKLEVIATLPTDGIIADFVNSSNSGGTTAAIKLSNADSEACDVVLGANRVGANFGSDFFISLSDSVDGSNQERFRITEAGNVGIGTTNPSHNLTINSATGGQLQFQYNTSSRLRIEADSGGGSYYAAAGFYHRFFTSGVERLRIDSSGNVGIGVSSPTAKLEVKGSGTSPIVYFGNGVDNAPNRQLAFSGGSSGLVYDLDATGASGVGGQLTLSTNGSERMRIDSSGNLILRNSSLSSPTSGFLKEMFIVSDDGTGTFAINGASNGSYGDFKFITRKGDSSDPITALTIDSSGVVQVKNVDSPTLQLFNTDASLTANQVVGDIDFYQSDPSGGGVGVVSKIRSINLSSFQGEAGLAFHTGTTSSLTERLRIDSSGNVGIGTDSPDSILTLNGSSSSRINLRTSETRYGTIFSDSGLLAIASITSIPIVFAINDVEKMRLDSSGNVGIGTTSPGYKLDVSGTGRASSSLRAPIFYDSDNTGYYVDPASTGIAAYLRGDIEIINEQPVLELNDYTATSTTNLNAWVSFQYNGTEGGYVGYGSDGNSNLYLKNYNGSVLIEGTLAETDNSFRAPIFYDSDNTSYYADPAGTSVLNVLTVGGSSVLTEGDTAIVRRRGTITSEDWNTYIDGTEAGWYQVNNASGSNKPPAYTYGTQLNFSTANANKLQIYAPHDATDGNGVWIRTGWSTDYDAWREIPLYGMNPYSGSNLRASVFYDSNNTAYYVDPASTSNLNDLTINRYFTGKGGTKVFDLYDNYLRFNQGGEFSSGIWIGSSDLKQGSGKYIVAGSSGGTTNSRVYIYGGTYTGANIIKIDGSTGIIQTSADSMRAPVFYDYNNTNYYADPGSTSQFNGLTVTNTINGSISGANAVNITGYGTGSFTFYQTSSSFSVFSGWHNYFIGNHGNGSNYYNTIIAMPFWGSPRYSRLEGGTQQGPFEFWTSEIAINSSQNITAPIYYDYNDTNYYVDPASTSNLSLLTVNSSITIGSPTGAPTTTRIKTTGGGSGGCAIFIDGSSQSTQIQVILPTYATGASFNNTGAFGANAMQFLRNGQNAGSITINTNYSTSYNTSSDYRLKENVVKLTDGIEKVKQLKPKRFNFILDENKQIIDGFIAHEAKEVVPESVTGEKDAIDYNGNPEYQGMDNAKLVPVLTAALQEAIAKIEDLETRIQILENQ